MHRYRTRILHYYSNFIILEMYWVKGSVQGTRKRRVSCIISCMSTRYIHEIFTIYKNPNTIFWEGVEYTVNLFYTNIYCSSIVNSSVYCTGQWATNQTLAHKFIVLTIQIIETLNLLVLMFFYFYHFVLLY